MATPKTVRLGVALSIATTGGALYYFLSDETNAEQLNATLVRTRNRISEFGNALKSRDTNVVHETVFVPQTSHSDQVPQQPPAGTTKTEQIVKDSEKSSTERSRRSAYCHTCSGARVWVFAEKLRLNRLFERQDRSRDEA